MGLEEGYVKRYKRGDVVPEGAIFLDYKQLINIQNKRLQQLSKEKPSTVRPLIYGPALIAAAASSSGFYFSYHFQQVFNLKQSGRLGIGLFLTSLLIPSGTLFGVYKFGVVPSVISGGVDCTICFETKLALCQAALGVGYPLMMSWLLSSMEAGTQYTYPIPQFRTGGPRLLPFLQSSAPKFTPLSMVLLANLSVAMGVGNKMQSCFEKHFSKDSESMLVQKRDIYSVK
ncbi:uncharacterized protein LOC132562143 [Ylistrum balloti]|uniref:uncharacterized protein LOC132562143 n=1 Tax=Ylistrum balloti TaxID=509963 RepID=UPI002905F068|nr:uncharacterized protein LOC132562143 [Ylistrum balloti]